MAGAKLGLWCICAVSEVRLCEEVKVFFWLADQANQSHDAKEHGSLVLQAVLVRAIFDGLCCPSQSNLQIYTGGACSG